MRMYCGYGLFQAIKFVVLVIAISGCSKNPQVADSASPSANPNKIEAVAATVTQSAPQAALAMTKAVPASAPAVIKEEIKTATQIAGPEKTTVDKRETTAQSTEELLNKDIPVRAEPTNSRTATQKQRAENAQNEMMQEIGSKKYNP